MSKLNDELKNVGAAIAAYFAAIAVSNFARKVGQGKTIAGMDASALAEIITPVAVAGVAYVAANHVKKIEQHRTAIISGAVVAAVSKANTIAQRKRVAKAIAAAKAEALPSNTGDAFDSQDWASPTQAFDGGIFAAEEKQEKYQPINQPTFRSKDPDPTEWDSGLGNSNGKDVSDDDMEFSMNGFDA